MSNARFYTLVALVAFTVFMATVVILTLFGPHQ